MSSQRVGSGPYTRQLLRESTPVAAILLFWVALSTPVEPSISEWLIRAGIIMAILYTVVRSVILAQEQGPITQATHLQGLLEENVRVALPAGVWFLSAQLVYVVEGLWDMLGIPGTFTSPADGVAFVLNGTGIAVVLLYAIWVGLPYVRGEIPAKENESTGTRRADE